MQMRLEQQVREKSKRNKALFQALLNEIDFLCDVISALSTKVGNIMSANGLSEVTDIVSGSSCDPTLSL
jgi:hypothetical protein